eukprot:CAMPEP_0170195612 /NCGR_PEP_ID=MMETSP0040_2-20121228/61833_1 /TAXON_ID=641309 /ORGANISM="Lotharella oceanica, Strain CCMP622" /LENGTH=108 /DNA_ID=CAMNT_0010444813 /DNA_START=78 /DNA_END=404 /DNA_ORIENTATION=-
MAGAFSRTVLRRLQAAAPKSRPTCIDPKKHSKVWLSMDVGAYPIIGVLTCAATMASFATVRTFSKAPQLTTSDKAERRGGMCIEAGGTREQQDVAARYRNFDRRFRRG